MRILAIRGKNLASLKEEFDIDFTSEPLKSAGIFAITGSTGAGKSTILDAISLALYAEVPRLVAGSNKKEGEEGLTTRDARRILRRGTAEGYAEVDFEARSGDTYRSRWEVRRTARKPTGKLQNETISVTHLPSDTPLQGNNKELKAQLEQLIGLSFDQFRRTILLAQGDFAAFLKAEEKEKTLLLEKVTGMNIFRRISTKLYARNKEEQNKIDLLTQQMAQITLLPETDIQEKQQRVEEINKEISDAQQKIELLKRHLEWHKELALRQHALKDKEVQLAQAKKEQEEAKTLREELNHAESVQPISSIYQSLIRSRSELSQKEGDKAILTTQAREGTIRLDAIVPQLEGAKRKLEECEQALEESIPKLKNARALDAVISGEKSRLHQLSSLLEVKSAEELHLAEEQLEKKLSDIELARKREEQLQHSISIEITKLREALKEGEACPVCGSTHHPMAHKISLVANDDERDKVNKEVQRLLHDADTLREKIGRLKQAVEQEDKYSEEYKVLSDLLQKHTVERSDYFSGQDADEVEARLGANIKGVSKEIRLLEEVKHKCERELEGLTGRLEEVSKRILELVADEQSYQTGIDEFMASRTDGLTIERLAQLLAYDSSWIAERRGLLKRIEDNLKESQLSYNERLRLLQEHESKEEKPSEDSSIDLVKGQVSSLTNKVSELTKEEKTISLQLSRDIDEQRRYNHLETERLELKPKAELWAKLNDLFGSANGDKFAKIAQRYTISNLLAYANKQLEMIAPRYWLKQVDADSLSLVVVDKDMLNEERSVFSLSGGETFLVSLSLALGLSSLSSRHVSIRSLFIDEGFGSLDAQTLSVALDALETLEAQQGRVIGVISHVQEMNERIATQIRVISKGNGGSHIEIKG